METRWGTFTDPWIIQPQPKCGFVFVGTDGTIASWDYTDHVPVQTCARRTAIEYVLGCINRGEAISGPLDPTLCLTAQRIVGTAALSAREKQTLALV